MASSVVAKHPVQRMSSPSRGFSALVHLYRLVQIVGDLGFPLYIFMTMIGICIWGGYWTNLIPQYARES
ncbi:hypothetical protein GB937_000114 [Aspergillus fischeri]|nr:hypothetical protein GB937_000114 [Aspergillus fischeri]